MKVKHRRTIIQQTRQVTTVRWGRHQQVRVQCELCAGESIMVTAEEAAFLSRTTARHIFRRVETGELHYWESADGELFVCRNSLELVR